MHLNLCLCIHLFHPSFIIEHLLCAGHRWKQQEGPWRRPSFLGRPLSWQPHGGGGRDRPSLAWRLQSQEMGSHGPLPAVPRRTMVRSWRALSSAAWRKYKGAGPYGRLCLGHPVLSTALSDLGSDHMIRADGGDGDTVGSRKTQALCEDIFGDPWVLFTGTDSRCQEFLEL